MKKIIRKSVAMLSALMLTVVSIEGNPALAKNTNFQIRSGSATVPVTGSASAYLTVRSNVADSGRQEYIEGTISYGYKKNLGVKVEGYYFDSRGIICLGSDYGQVASGYSYQKKLGFSTRGKGICSPDYKAKSEGFINNVKIGSVTCP